MHIFLNVSQLNFVRTQKKKVLRIPLIVYMACKLGGPADEAWTYHGVVSQQVWHDKDPFLLKGQKHRAKT